MIGKNSLLIVFLVGGLALAAPVSAQNYDNDKTQMKKHKNRGKGKRMGKGIGGGGMGMRHDTRLALFRHLYPVRLVRQHSAKLNLTDKQINKLQNVVSDVQGEIERLKWDVQRESQKLVTVVKNGGTKEQVYKQMDRVFRFENKIKKKHLGLMIVVRDILTVDQRKYLDKVKTEAMERFEGDSERRGEPGGPGGPGGPDGPPL